ncbi:MAG: hypothetical protein ACRD3A_00385 [Terriglobales bacterium]
MFFKRKPQPLTVGTERLHGIPGDLPLLRIAGSVPPGSEGNAVVAACFNQISETVDIAAFAGRLLVYDMTGLRYEFGDHVGAFFWNLPALLDGVAILVAATGDTRRNLESLRQFVGAWLPLGLYDSLPAISAHIRDVGGPLNVLADKRDACAQRGQALTLGPVKIVLLGSRQTGQQYRTRRKHREKSDLDCGVVGGPKELAVLTMKFRRQPGVLPNVEHPPIKVYSSPEEAIGQGLLVIAPK